MFFPLLSEIPPAPGNSLRPPSAFHGPVGHWHLHQRVDQSPALNANRLLEGRICRRSSGCWCHCWYIKAPPYNSLYHKVPTVTTTTVSQQTFRQGYRSTSPPVNRLGDVEQGPKGGGNCKYDNASLRFICWICWISQLGPDEHGWIETLLQSCEML